MMDMEEYREKIPDLKGKDLIHEINGEDLLSGDGEHHDLI